MREIKFRAWDERRKIMHQKFNFIQSFGEGNNWIIPILPISNPDWIKDLQENITSAPHFRQQFKLMQFTGLKDKNGKEIYEGDIVKKCSWIDWGTNKTRLWRKGREIVWNDIEASFVFKEEDGSLDCFSLNNKCGYEVIGNIYENPELLKEKE